MTNKQIIYETLLNEHRLITNQIADIKASNYDLSDEQKQEIQQLQKRQIELMGRMKVLFNGSFGK
jgi:hypothetical protein